MKNIFNSIFPALTLASFLLSPALCAIDSYTLPNGKVLENPYVISQSPDAVVVGHKYGAMTIKFKDLPEDVQKKFNYDPLKAAEYEKEQQKLKELQQKKKAEAASRKAEQDKILSQNRKEWKKDRLTTEIQKTNLRIEFLKTEIPKLEKDTSELMGSKVKLAGTSVTDDRYNYSWDGGFVTTSGSNRAESTKRKTMKGLEDEYTKSKRTLKNYKSELQQKQLDIVSMEKQLEQLNGK